MFTGLIEEVGTVAAIGAEENGNKLKIAAPQLANEVRRILELPDVVKSLTELGAEPAPSTPDEFVAYTSAERTRWGEVVRASGAKID